MTNFETFKEMQEDFANNEHLGSMERENSAYIESLSGKLNHLKEVWISIGTTVINSDFTYSLLDGLIALSEGIERIIKSIDELGITFPTVIALFGGLSSTLKKSSSINSIADVFNSANKEMTKSQTITSTLTGKFSKGAGLIANFVKQGLLIGGITLVVQGLAKGWDYLSNNLDNTAEKLNEIETQQLDDLNVQKDKLKTLETIGVRYEELANKASRTAEEEAEMLEIGNRLAEVLPNIKIGSDENGNAIINMTSDMEGYITKTKEAIKQQERLLLDTRLEQAENNIKRLSKGEFFGIGNGYLEEQESIQNSYDNLMKKHTKIRMNLISNTSGKELEELNKNFKQIKENYDKAYKDETLYIEKYIENRKLINEASQETKEAMSSLWQTKASDNLTDELENSINSFVNSLNFSSVDNFDEFDSLKKMFSELPTSVEKGKINIDEINESIKSINSEFSKTNNIDAFNSEMLKLSKIISDKTGWDLSLVNDLLTGVDENFLKVKQGLEGFLYSFNKTTTDISNGDLLAEGLQKQFDSIDNWIDTLLNHDFKDVDITKNLVVELKKDETLPQKVNDIVSTLDQLKVDEEVTLSLATQIMLDLHDNGIIDNIVDVKNSIDNNLKSELGEKYEEKIQLQIHALLDSLTNRDEVRNEIKQELKTVSEEVSNETLKTNAKVEADVKVEGNIDDSSVEEVKEQVQADIETINDIKEVAKEIEAGKMEINFISNANEIKGEIDGLVVSVNDLINGINQVKTTNVNIETAQSAKNISGLIDRINEYLSKSKNIKTLKFNSETAQASKNISGLKNNINSYLDIVNKIKPVTFKTETAQASKNISGLMNKISSFINTYAGKTYTTKFETITSNNTVAVPKITTPQKRTVNIVEENGVSTYNAQSNIDTLNDNLSVVNSSTSPISRALSSSNALEYFKLDVNPFEDLENALDRINDKLDLLSKKSDDAYGTKKIKYLDEQKYLLLEQQKILHEKSKDLLTYQNELKYYLSQQGVLFNGDEITNYQSKLLDIQRKLEFYQNSKKDKKDSSKEKSYEKEIEQLEKLKSALEEYKEVSSDMSDVTSEIYDVTKAMNELRQETIKAKEQMYNFDIQIDIGEIEIELSKIERELKGLDREIKNTFSKDKIDLINKKTQVIKNQQKEIHNLANEYRKQSEFYKNFLNAKGFIFEPDGNIGNLQHLETLQDSGVYETIIEYIEKYYELTNDTIPSLSEEWWQLQDDIKDCADEIKKFEKETRDKLKSVKNLVKDLRLDILEGQLKAIRFEQEKIDKLLSNTSSYGNQIKLINEKLILLNEEKQRLKDILSLHKEQASIKKQSLSNYGFSFDKNGNISNLEHINTFIDKENFNEVQELLKEYVDLTTNLLPNAQQEWEKIGWEIEDVQDKIEDLRKEQIRLIEEAKYKTITDNLKDLNNEYDLLQKKLEHATGTNKIQLLKKEIELIEKQKNALKNQENYLKQKHSDLQQKLTTFGFKFEDNGDISNYVDNLTKISESHNNFEESQKLLEEYFTIQDEELPNLEKEWLDYDNAIKDALKEQLKITKDVQDKIINIYKKQLEERKKLIDEELEKRIDALDKEKQAYLDYRAEADYKNEYDEQLKKVMELQKMLEIASKDDSLTGQKKYKDLLKELEEAQKELEDIVQDKIDKDVIDKFEDEKDRIENEAEAEKDKLDEEYSDEKLQELADKVLNSGIFEGINGEIRNLNDVIVEYINKYEEGMSAIGGIIKDEWLTNLSIAKDTMLDMNKILNELELNNNLISPKNNSRSRGYSMVDDSKSINTITTPVNITIQGNVDKNIMNELKNVTKNVLSEIMREYR